MVEPGSVNVTQIRSRGSRMKHIPVSEEVWCDMISLRGSGQTFDELLIGMIEGEKKHRLVDDMRRIEKEGEFVDLE